MLDVLVPETVFAFLLLFARIGAALMLLPGFGELYVAPRIRLLLALAITLVLMPVLSGGLPGLPGDPASLLLLLGGEIAVGVFLGVLAQIILSALHTAGMIVAFQSGFANALAFDPNTNQQGSLAGLFLGTTALLLLFVAGGHHLMLRAVADSYGLFVPGDPLPVGDFSMAVTDVVARSFALALQIAAPFIVVGLLFYLGLGLLARLMPQVQVFFIAMPLQILLGLFLLALTVSALMMWFMTRFRDLFGAFLATG